MLLFFKEKNVNLYLGVDLGTSAVKVILVSSDGAVLNTVTKEYELYFPHPGWAEENPDDWWNMTKKGIKEVIQGFNGDDIRALAVAGQMHGLVTLDENDNVIRPAILWNDGRCDRETDYLNNVIGKEFLSRHSANIAFAGFTLPKILWMRHNEREAFEKIKKIMLPKDYINYKLTGEFVTDYSDASGMLLLDVENKKWSDEMIEIAGIDKNMLASLHESYDSIGKIKKEIADELGLAEDVLVAAGAGDNAAAAIGTATVGSGRCNISLGTSGTIFISSKNFNIDKYNALHSFAHADGNYHLMGCMLSAGSASRWWMLDILGTHDYPAEEDLIKEEKLGRNKVFFLPYLMGERSPINDTDARATFTGISMDTSKADLTQSVLEGVAFAFRDSFEVAKSFGIDIKKSTVCGGGSRSPLWRKIIANVLGIPLEILETEQGPGYGACILAMVADGIYGSVEEASRKLVKIKKTEYPDVELAKLYDERYAEFKEIYPAMKGLFKKLGGKQGKNKGHL